MSKRPTDSSDDPRGLRRRRASMTPATDGSTSRIPQYSGYQTQRPQAPARSGATPTVHSDTTLYPGGSRQVGRVQNPAYSQAATTALPEGRPLYSPELTQRQAPRGSAEDLQGKFEAWSVIQQNRQRDPTLGPPHGGQLYSPGSTRQVPSETPRAREYRAFCAANGLSSPAENSNGSGESGSEKHQEYGSDENQEEDDQEEEEEEDDDDEEGDEAEAAWADGVAHHRGGVVERWLEGRDE